MPNLTTNYSLNKPLVNDATDEDLWGGYLNDSMDDIDTQMKATADAVAAVSTIPVGTISCYGGTSAPSLWLLCYGQAVDRTTYSALFTALGTTYGSGDGSTTFNLPDLRGRVVAGQDDMGGTSANRLTNQTGGLDGDTLGATGGAETHTLTEAQMPSHYHVHGIYSETQSNSNYKRGGSETKQSFGTATTTSGAGSTANTGSGSAHNNVQPTIILNYIVYAGV